MYFDQIIKLLKWQFVFLYEQKNEKFLGG